MERLKKGDIVDIHSYKHDGSIHRIWKKSIVLEIDDNHLILGNYRVTVIEADGRSWRPKYEAIIHFYKKNWFNVIAQLKDNGISYYCNIATPYHISENTIKYIDYDLDLRVAADLNYRVVDREEYQMHKTKYSYSDEIDKIVHYELDALINLVENKLGPFKDGCIDYYHNIYRETLKISN